MLKMQTDDNDDDDVTSNRCDYESQKGRICQRSPYQALCQEELRHSHLQLQGYWLFIWNAIRMIGF